MNNQQEQAIIQALSQHLGIEPEKLALEADLSADLNLNALELIDLATTLKQAFDVEIEPEEAPTWKTVADIVHSVSEKCPSGPRPQQIP